MVNGGFMKNKLVSIVSPCYNGESYIARYLDSILSQTYRPLELILVNDGSVDKTDEIIMSYRKKLSDSNILFKYLKKENGGVGAAINDGIKHITGDYLIYPDTDDFLYPESIEKRVDFLEKHPEFGMMISDGEKYSENDLRTPKHSIRAIVPQNGDLFDNLVSGNVVYTPGGYMFRMSAFRDVNPALTIFPSRYGQAIQMLLPVAYKYKCGHLCEPLYGRVDRADSLSKRVWNENNQAWKNRILGLEEIYVETLKSIGDDALAYIPYIYLRSQRSLVVVAKKVSPSDYKEQRIRLIKSVKLVFKELIKGIINIITNRF